MKKTFITVMLILISVASFSQSVYLRAGTGYGLPVATSVIGENYLHVYDYTNLDVPNTYSSEVVSASYGAGANFNFALGYKFNENLLFDLNVQYLAGKKYRTSDNYSYNNGSFTGSETDEYTTSSHGLYFNPSVVFSAGFGKGAPYGRFGLVVASPTVTSDESYFYDLDGTTTTDITWKYKKGMALGYQAAIGMNWKLSDKLDFYTEVNFISMTYYPGEGEMTKYVYDGSDMLDQMNVSSKNVTFEKSYNPQDQYNPDVPRVAPRESYPFSSVSAQVGVRFSLWEKKE